ncbi:MAG: hypothetical protein LBD99_00065 [Candidatus Margulisbacteria bacterium]|jgi:hypothetical protein|nr:hypothetical protein [Candidatus Margulisiibacteriota bacterium]
MHYLYTQLLGGVSANWGNNRFEWSDVFDGLKIAGKTAAGIAGLPLTLFTGCGGDKSTQTAPPRNALPVNPPPAIQYRPVKPPAFNYDYKAYARKYIAHLSKITKSIPAYPEDASADLVYGTYKGRNIFMTTGSHYFPGHIENMEKIFTEQDIETHTDDWLFLLEGCSAEEHQKTSLSDYLQVAEYPVFENNETFYAALSAKAWHIPLDNIIPGFKEPEVVFRFWDKVGLEKGIIYIFDMTLMLHSRNIRNSIMREKELEAELQEVDLLVDKYLSSRNMLEKYDFSKLDEYFIKFSPLSKDSDLSMGERITLGVEVSTVYREIRNEIARGRLDAVLEKYPDRKNILVYCGAGHKEVFISQNER